MDVSFNLKGSAHEFDLLRTAVEVRQNQQLERSQDTTVDAASRRKSREEAVELADLLTRLR